MLLARIYEHCPLLRPNCGGEIRISAFTTVALSIPQIVQHPG